MSLYVIEKNQCTYDKPKSYAIAKDTKKNIQKSTKFRKQMLKLLKDEKTKGYSPSKHSLPSWTNRPS